jgi:hypothetical protein
MAGEGLSAPREEDTEEQGHQDPVREAGRVPMTVSPVSLLGVGGWT